SASTWSTVSRGSPGASSPWAASGRRRTSRHEHARRSDPVTGPEKPPTIRPGLVSVILVNYRGADDTITCLRSFEGVEWPADRLELLVVDNASGDGSAARIRAAVPGVQVVESDV